MNELQAVRKSDKLAARLGARIDFLTAEIQRVRILRDELAPSLAADAMDNARESLGIALTHLVIARDRLR